MRQGLLGHPGPRPRGEAIIPWRLPCSASHDELLTTLPSRVCTIWQVSVYFEHPTLGMYLVPAAAAVRQAPDTNNTSNGASAPRTYIAPAIVSSVQNTEVHYCV